MCGRVRTSLIFTSETITGPSYFGYYFFAAFFFSFAAFSAFSAYYFSLASFYSSFSCLRKVSMTQGEAPCCFS